MYVQECENDINSSSKLECYCKYKINFKSEIYCSVLSIRKYKSALARFGCANHKLAIETG